MNELRQLDDVLRPVRPAFTAGFRKRRFVQEQKMEVKHDCIGFGLPAFELACGEEDPLSSANMSIEVTGGSSAACSIRTSCGTRRRRSFTI
jgi:hypothetical protein